MGYIAFIGLFVIVLIVALLGDQSRKSPGLVAGPDIAIP